MDTEFALTARADFLLSGNWSQFKDHTSMRGSENGALLGIALNYERGEYGTAGPVGGEIESVGVTADLSLEGDGWNAMFALIWYSYDSDVTGGIDEDVYGLVAQGGVFFTDDTEGFARLEWGDVDSLTTGFGTMMEMDELLVLTVGVNKYYYGHDVKWTTDIGYAFDAVDGANWGSTTAGWRGDGYDDDSQIVIRTQLQLLF